MGFDTGWTDGSGRSLSARPLQRHDLMSERSQTPSHTVQCVNCELWFTPRNVTHLSPPNKTGPHCKYCHSQAMAEPIRKRSGATTVECSRCGSRVLMHESVRVLTAGRSGRLCRYCEGTDPIPPWCRQGDHHLIITPADPNWDSAIWDYEPLPEWSKPGLCSDCGEQLILLGSDGWVPMSWPQLAVEWGKADAR